MSFVILLGQFIFSAVLDIDASLVRCSGGM